MSIIERAVEHLFFANATVGVAWDALVSEVGATVAYGFRCVQIEYQISHSERLLRLAAFASKQHGEGQLSDYFFEHLGEEEGHHDWARNDLQKMLEYCEAKEDFSLPLMIVRPVRELIEKQYAHLGNGREGCLFFLGYVVALEGFPGSADQWRRFATNEGLPLDAFESPIQHAEKDQGHARELFEFIGQHYNAEPDLDIILDGAAGSLRMLVRTIQAGGEIEAARRLSQS